MIELNKIIHGDCMDIMKDIPDKYFELAIVDPPYGIGNFQQSDRGNEKSVTWNNQIPNKEYFNELERVSKEQIIWGANYYNCFNGDNGAIIWDKGNPHPAMSRCEIASCSSQKRVVYYKLDWYGFNVNRNGKTIHPCEKPVQLYKWLLKNYANIGDKILDTHSGSGTLAVACIDMGFEYLCIEKDKDYYEASLKRVAKESIKIRMAM